eukprot:973723-Karenia_brevis.AAC.1
MSEEWNTPAHELVGGRVDEYIASQLSVKDGGAPQPRTVRQVISRCQQPTWYPGKPSEARAGAGRKPIYSEHQKDEVARVGMDLKRKLVRPTPRRVRARLPQVARNTNTGRRMSDKTVQRIFQTRCYDESEDDPWMYLASPAQD